MKKALIVLLVCVNLLFAALLFGVTLPRAGAQTIRGASNYLVVTGKYEDERVEYDAVYVVDLVTRRLAGMRFDKRARRMVPLGRARDLGRDFQLRSGRP